jgi:hypothetical protein
MKLTSRFVFLLSLVPGPTFAASLSGALVDANCYAIAQQNFSHGHPGSNNTKRAVRSCSPNEKTKSFSVVPQNGMTFNLDSNGNEKARELVLKGGKKSLFMVTITGDITQDTLKVDTISIAK